MPKKVIKEQGLAKLKGILLHPQGSVVPKLLLYPHMQAVRPKNKKININFFTH